VKEFFDTFRNLNHIQMNRYLLLSFLFPLFIGPASFLSAQGNLEFSGALIVSNSELTVPAGKVWKVTSVYGFEANFCLYSTTFNNCNYGPNNSFNMSVSGFVINGVPVLSECTMKRVWASTNCTGTNNTFTAVEALCGNQVGALGYAPKLANPNILPMWLPVGTTLKSIGPATFLSVLEFNIVE